MSSRRVVMGLQFFPRGGSAHVARAIAGGATAKGWATTIVSGSVRAPDGHGDAAMFYDGLDARPFDMTDAMASPDPLLAAVPLHASYEDRPGAADRVFASVDDRTFEHQVAAWSAALAGAGAATADVLHLHHLTPLNEAAQRVAPDVPVIGHLHGTELLLLEAIARGAPVSWQFADAWAERMRGWAGRCARLLLISASQVDRVEALLGVPRERTVVVPNGFEPELFQPRPADRLAHWRRFLVDEPRGQRPDGSVISYTESDLAAFGGPGPTLLYVGRFTEVKRLPLLIEAHHAARAQYGARLPLVVLGGYPGEWEGEHPVETVERIGAEDVFFAGWHGHDALPEFLAASDVITLASVREQFGQVLVEAMACGLPPVAVGAFGPAEIVDPGHTGWLVPPDDRAALTAAMVEVALDPAEGVRRGEAARRAALERYSWPALVDRVLALYGTVASDGRGRYRGAD
ncbi:MAG: glycosyltransferase family 4 protein [Mycobacteriales bacterium]